MKFQIWECKIVVPGDAVLPPAFDMPPRIAAQVAINLHGIEVISCFSGWGGSLTDFQHETVVTDVLRRKQ